MKSWIPVSCGILFTFFIISCQKSGTNAPVVDPPVKPDTGAHALNINMCWPGLVDTGRLQYELIVSEPGGALLLDTIIWNDVPAKVSLTTKAKLVDVTSAYFVSGSGWQAVTYKSVDPSSWGSSVEGDWHNCS